MKNQQLKNWVRILLLICSIALIYVLFVPLWRIDLDAPQYPEGLRLLIFPSYIGGNVDIINGLNHYIGMKTLHTEDFIEFKILPILIGIFSALFLLVAIINRTKYMNALLVLFILFGIVAMVDFYIWEYNYGHNLDPNAAIIVPGMAYQPPLIGFKQLLNFGAYSIPDIGGWIFISVGLILAFCVFFTQKTFLNKLFSKKGGTQLSMVLFFSMLLSCNTAVDPIKYGKDNCQYCKMTISDKHYGAEVITQKGKVYKFDEIRCLISYINENESNVKSVSEYYLTDFTGKNELVKKENLSFLKSDKLKSPMGGNIASFSNKDSLNVYRNKLGGEIVTWETLLK